jgi:ADP-glucose pyrophosphorylase
LKNSLKERFVDYWKDNIQQSGKQTIRTFKRLKIHLEFEKYISEIGNIHRYYKAITKLLQSLEFRLIDYLLKQVDNRYYNVPYKERICQHCNLTR